MVTSAQVESFKEPLVILFSIPLATVGAVLMLFLTNTTFNIQGFGGAIMLAGMLTTVLAMVPLAIGVGEGGEVQAPMARVVIGGLSAATLITLAFIPTLYTTVEEKRTQEQEETTAGVEPATG